jgi:crossover junction endodeoxyribonuclease RuvC
MKQRNVKFVACGCIVSRHNTSLSERLLKIAKELEQLVKKYQPDIAGIEKLFFFKNTKTAMDVGQARGVALLVLAKCCIIIKEPTPLQIKQTITGYGRADKTQIARMIKVLLKLKNVPKSDDAADALAVALTVAQTVSHTVA